ncbi:hypothetical protein LCGC14_2484030, partial [marine sediment metagenome]
MKNKLLTYGDWVKKAGRENELGTKALITDKMLMRVKGWEKILAKIMAGSIAKSLVEG